MSGHFHDDVELKQRDAHNLHATHPVVDGEIHIAEVRSLCQRATVASLKLQGLESDSILTC